MIIRDSRIVILAPHPDDEMLACFQVLRDSTRYHNDVYVVFVTNGDYKNQEEIRAQEAKKALADLGIPEYHIIHLGFSDMGMRKEKSQIYKLIICQNGDEIVSGNKGDYTNGPGTQKEFSYLKNGEHMLYTKNNLLNILNEVVTEIRPEYLFIPHRLDMHADHVAVNMCVQEMLRERKLPRDLIILQYLIHTLNDMTWPNRSGDQFECAPLFTEEEWGRRIIFTVNDPAEKERYICIYDSQKPRAFRKYLLSFSKKEEIYWKL